MLPFAIKNVPILSDRYDYPTSKSFKSSFKSPLLCLCM